MDEYSKKELLKTMLKKEKAVATAKAAGCEIKDFDLWFQDQRNTGYWFVAAILLYLFMGIGIGIILILEWAARVSGF